MKKGETTQPTNIIPFPELGRVTAVPVPKDVKDYLDKRHARNPAWGRAFCWSVEIHYGILEGSIFSRDSELEETGREGILELCQSREFRLNFRNAKMAELEIVFKDPSRLDRLKTMADIAGTTLEKLLQFAVLQKYQCAREFDELQARRS